jgi:hypothetical protein
MILRLLVVSRQTFEGGGVVGIVTVWTRRKLRRSGIERTNCSIGPIGKVKTVEVSPASDETSSR